MADTYPRQQPGESFDDHQAAMAEWMGVDVATLNATHDRLHFALCQWLGVASHSMMEAVGVALTPEQQRLAALEEEAVLHCQRFLHAMGADVPGR